MRARRTCALITVALGASLSACGEAVDGTPTANDTGAVTASTQTSAPTRSTLPPVTTTAATTTQAPAAQVAEYMGTANGSYYFTSPSSKFECAVVTAPNPVAGCHGALPPDAPTVNPASGTGTVAPNSIRVTGSGPGEFVSTGDPAFHRFDAPAKALPYGSPLRVQGFTCTVDETMGVTCSSSAGHGFTVSDRAYRLW
ncbi:hypothetical protein [Rhodococcus gannanensis]|uniref:Lipoprotein n=1 Tax=Rhodococcus gannanensis TaxID=1960308 RepID=A0ABW4P2S7_9NOCA